MILDGRRVLAGAEPFTFPGSSTTGVVLVHGFTGSPFEVRPVGEALAAAGIGSEGVLLRGHGTHPEDMVGVPYTAWIEDVDAAVGRALDRWERVILVGLSMGGTLVLNVGARRSQEPRLVGLVTISAPLELDDWRLGLAGPLSRVIKWQAWGRPDIKDTSAWDSQVSYRRIRTPAIVQLLALMRDTTPRLGAVQRPIRIFQSQVDHVVPSRNADLIRQAIGSTQVEVVYLDNCYHVSTMDHAAGQLNAAIVQFATSLSSPA